MQNITWKTPINDVAKRIKLNKKKNAICVLFLFRRRPTFPGGFPPSIISTAELNYRVRNGNGCDLCVIVTEYLLWGIIPLETLQSQNWIMLTLIWNIRFIITHFQRKSLSSVFRSSPRSISIAQLSTLLHLHLRPINHVVYMGPYYLMVWDILSWGGLHA